MLLWRRGILLAQSLAIAIALSGSRPAPAGVDALAAGDPPPPPTPRRDETRQDRGTMQQRRRVRYSGKYPRRFEERHKELGGDDATVKRVLLKGGTPAGSHVPIMATECLEHLGLLQQTKGNTAKNDADDDAGTRPLVAVDCTLGYGGHSQLILDALSRWSDDDGDDGGDGERSAVLVSFDRDSVELAKTEARLRSRWEQQPQRDDDDNDDDDDGGGGGGAGRVRLECVHSSFADVADSLSKLGLPPARALLADLGCSSMQVDDPSRGFTWKADGPLDMRMDAASSSTTASAASLLGACDVASLAAMLRGNSDFGRADARRLAAAVLRGPVPATTSELCARVRGVVPPPTEAAGGRGAGGGGGRRPTAASGGGGGAAAAAATEREGKELMNSRIARVMQALRIEVNGEFAALDSLLGSLPRALAPGGRAVFLTFHSGEDRRVKAAMRDGMRTGVYSEVSRRVIRPGPEEARANPRSRCCKLRWCVRSSAPTSSAA